MSCDRYWRDGILLAERGEPDPHRDTCITCRREHKARDELIAALPLVGGTSTGDPSWEARVWHRIARLEPRGAGRRRWWQRGGFVAAFAVAVVCLVIARRGPPDEPRPPIEFVPGEVAMRSSSSPGSPSVGDRVRVTVGPGEEVRIYRADHLVLRCPVASSAAGCRSDARGLIAEALLATAGDYRIVIIKSATADPVGGFDGDLGAIVAAGGEYRTTELAVR
jgi:hypothetical protein